MKKITFLIVLIALCFSWNGIAQITAYPYSEDFETGDGGWVATNGANGTWALGTPTANVINSAASGTKAWATNLSGNYNASENSYVKSPVFDFSTLTAPSIEFSVWWNSEFSWDGMVLQSSINNGTSWQVVGAYGDPNNWYTDNTINGNPGGQQLGWTGRNSSTNGSNGWRVARHALTGLAGQSNVIFRFAFGSDTSVQDNGVAFDLVTIFEVSCPEPANLLLSSVQETNANLAWTAGGTQTEWEFINQPQGTAAPTNSVSGTPISTPFVTVMNLVEGSYYQFYVRTACGSGEFSSWVGPLNYRISGPGETCSNPIIVTTPLPYITTDNTANYLDDYEGSPGASCGSTFSYLAGDDVVYAYTPTSDTSIDIKLSNISDTYAGMFVYNSCASIGVSCLTGATNSFSQADMLIDNFSVTAGQTYYIVISTWASPQSIAYTLTITENTCVDPVVTYTTLGDCEVAPQFYVKVNLTNLGSASSITMTDNQSSAPQVVSATGLYIFGPYPNQTNVVITTANTDDANCTLTSPTLTQQFCQDFTVNCAVGPATLNYCYNNGGATNPVIFSFTSIDGNSLNLTFNAGQVENNWDELVIIDTNGSFIVAPTANFYGAGGNLAGLTYQSTGDKISFYINSDGSGSCQSSSYTPIDVSVSCATCTNPAATYAVRGDCLTAPQFFTDVNVTSLGSANSLTLTDNQGSAPQTVTTTGLVTFGPYPNATNVIITLTNDDDVNCIRNSSPLTQPYCLENLVNCNVGPLNISYCYPNNATNTFSYVSSDGSPLNLTIISGELEGLPWDYLTIYDSDGTTVLYTGEGNNGILTGLTWQSTGDTIYFKVTSDSIISCGSGSYSAGINYTVSCATCINPTATYAVIDDCENGQQFLIDVNVSSLGDANSVTVTDNQGSAGVQLSATGVVQMGPYPFGTPIIITISNDQDVNCVINSSAIQVAACPPANDNCSGALVAVVNQGATCDLITPGPILAATPTGVPPSSCGGNPNDDVWFQFTALHDVELISLLNIAGGTTNLYYSVYSGTCGTLTEVFCSDDTANFVPNLVIGNTYYIRVYSFGSVPTSTTFNLCIKQAPSNLVCQNAVNFCGNNGALITDSIIGVPSTGAIACLTSVQNPAWNIIQIGQSGLINLQISQNTQFDANGNPVGQGLDVDYALWGPFTSITDACLNLTLGCPTPSDCPGIPYTPEFYPYGNIIDCSWSAAAVETATIDNALAGEIYVLLVSNYSNQAGTIQIQQTNGGTVGAGSTVAEIQVDLGGDQSLCGEDSVVLTANSPFADVYEWYADGFVIEGQTGPTLTVTETNTYTVIVYDSQCDSYAEAEVIITLGLEAVANPVADIITCDDVSGDGFESFDLEAQTATILGSQNPALFTVTYHLSQSDAITGTGALTSPYTNISSPQTIWVRVADANSPNCIATTSFNLVITGATPTATSVDFEVCDDPSGNGVEAFDLTSHDTYILNGQNSADFTVTYYTSVANAEAGTSALSSPYTNTSSPQTIWARVDNNGAVDCYAIVDFDLIVSAIPVTSFTTDMDYQVCPNATVPILITATPQNYSAGEVTVVWTQDGVIIPGQTGLTLPVLTSGLYEIEVTFTDSGCSANPVGVTVIQLQNCIIPQGISPDGDGKNDTFDLSNFGVKRIEIFNRLGTLVYSKDNYTNEWYGQSNNGNELPVGTYFYTMVYEGGAKQMSAWVYINR